MENLSGHENQKELKHMIRDRARRIDSHDTETIGSSTRTNGHTLQVKL